MAYKFRVGDIVNCKPSSAHRIRWNGSVIIALSGRVDYPCYEVKNPSGLEGLLFEVEIELFQPLEVGDAVCYLDHNAAEKSGELIEFHEISGISGWFIMPTSSEQKPIWLMVSDIIGKIAPKSAAEKALDVVNEIKKVFLSSEFDDQSHGYIVEDLLHQLEGYIIEAK